MINSIKADKLNINTTVKEILRNPVKRASYLKYEEGIPLSQNNQIDSCTDELLSDTVFSTDTIDDLVIKKKANLYFTKSELGNWTPPSVGVRSRIVVDAISDVNEEITVVVELVMHFRDPEAYDINPIVTSAYLPCDEKKLTKAPVLEILHVRKQRDINKRYFYETKTGVIFLIYEFRADIRELLDLRRFPFDRQVFKLEIRSFASKFEEWSPLVTKPPRVADHPLWDEYEHLVSYDAASWQLAWSSCKVMHKNSSYTWNLYFGASRSPRFYMMHFVLVIFIVVAISTFTIAVEPHNFEGRCQLTFTLVLTLVAFKFTISAMVPRINYQTFFDMYVLFSFIMLGSMIIENFAVSQLFFTDDLIPERIDKIFAICYAGIWIILHIILTIGAYGNLFYESWEVVKARKLESSVDNIQFLMTNVTL